jgi:hypothetical protein
MRGSGGRVALVDARLWWMRGSGGCEGSGGRGSSRMSCVELGAPHRDTKTDLNPTDRGDNISQSHGFSELQNVRIVCG